LCPILYVVVAAENEQRIAWSLKFLDNTIDRCYPINELWPKRIATRITRREELMDVLACLVEGGPTKKNTTSVMAVQTFRQEESGSLPRSVG